MGCKMVDSEGILGVLENEGLREGDHDLYEKVVDVVETLEALVETIIRATKSNKKVWWLATAKGGK